MLRGMTNVHTFPAHRRTRLAMLVVVGVLGVVGAAGGQSDGNVSVDANGPTPQPTTAPATREEPAPLLFRDDTEEVSPGGGSDMLSKMTVSIVVVGVLGVAAWIAIKKLGPRVGLQSGRKINVVETVYLGPKKCLHLVEIDGQRLLLGSTAEGVSMLSHLQGADAIEGKATFHLADEGDTSTPTSESASGGGE